jgi:hypothetical protein
LGLLVSSQFHFHISRVEVCHEQFLDYNNQMRREGDDLCELVVILLSFNEEIVLLDLSCAVGLEVAGSDIFFRFCFSSSVFRRSLVDLVSAVFLFPCLRF